MAVCACIHSFVHSFICFYGVPVSGQATWCEGGGWVGGNLVWRGGDEQAGSGAGGVEGRAGLGDDKAVASSAVSSAMRAARAHEADDRSRVLLLERG